MEDLPTTRSRKGFGRTSRSLSLPSKPVARKTRSASTLVPSSRTTPFSEKHHPVEALLKRTRPRSAMSKKPSGRKASWQMA